MATSSHRWLEPALRLQSRAACLVIAGFSVLAAIGLRFGLGVQVVVLLSGIVFVGFPHGAFDHLVARPVFAPRFGRLWWGPFGLAYLGLAGAVWLAWAIAPLATLVLFLVGSVLHFGLGDTEDGIAPRGIPRWMTVLVYGMLPILLPIAIHPSDAAPVLAALGGVRESTMASALSWTVLLIPFWLGASAWVSRAALREGSGLVGPVVTAVGFVLLPPLLAFGLYFGLVHSPRHVLRLGAWHDPRDPRRAMRWAAQTLVPAGAVCALGLSGLWLAGQDNSIDVLAPMFRIIAALTLPHMIVTALLNQAETTS